MENVCLFDVLNGGFQSKLVSSNNVLNCNLNNDVFYMTCTLNLIFEDLL